MNLEQVNKLATTQEIPGEKSSSNVSTFVKKEEKSYVRRYAMTEGRRRVWLENFKPEDGYSIMFPPSRLMSGQEAAKEPARREKAKVLIACLVIALILLLLYPLIRFTLSRLVIGDVRVEGNSIYTADELLAAGGLSIGDRLPILSVNTAEKTLLGNMPYIQSCNISVKLPGTVIFEVEDEIPFAYTEMFGEYYALSSELKVLERADSNIGFSELLYVKLPFAERAVVGEQIQISENEDGEYIKTFFSLLSESDLCGRVDIVYFDEKYDIVASVDGKYRVLFGSPFDMKLKMATVSKIIDENSDACQSNGIVDVRVVEIAGIIINADIDPDSRE